MGQITIDEAAIHALQARAEALARGTFDDACTPPPSVPALADLQRAIEVLGAHTEQGLRRQHAYIAALSTAQEAERGRIARELHDDVVQQLIALGQSIDRVQRLLERGEQAPASERLQQMRGSVTGLVAELRTVIGDLRPPALEELGLIPALEVLLRRSQEQPPQVTLTVEGTPRRLAPQSELALFRIVQEAWSNSRRHGQARHVRITMHYDTTEVQVHISDDGIGFVPPAADAAPDGHWGVRGMRERAELTGGTLQLHSAPGQGTQIDVCIPYPGVAGRDPVCGMTVVPGDLGSEHGGQMYRFCSPACRDLFLARPEQYILPHEA
jgi:signal transduction histidine kinase/YHS domain-containing protein